MVFHWSQSDSKSSQVSMTPLSILSDLHNAVVWMVSALLSIFNPSRVFTKPLEIVPSAPITIGITVTVMFHRFSLALRQDVSIYPSFRYLWFSRCGRQIQLLGRFFLLTITKSGLLTAIKWSICISQSLRILCLSLSRTDSGSGSMVKLKFFCTIPNGLYSRPTHIYSCTLVLLLFSPSDFFTSVLADGFSLEFEWQQVSSSLQDSSHDSGRSQQCCRLDSLYPSANFQVLQAF